ncbi:hypothetical protein A163_21745 [Vibrio tasmaniensis 1F-267]|uniref:Uncharacterized protein n=2 Tax=Vibrionaceae TaxID=641 RepID=A0ABX3B544_9VIBR|nr:hypothetical protein A163_21745 [Vibrio tasmaniensis 1F-267]
MTACDTIAVPLANIKVQTNDLVLEAINLAQVELKIDASIEEVNSIFDRFTEEINRRRQTKKAYSDE